MSNVHQLRPIKGLTMKITVQRGPEIVVSLGDGWTYPMSITPEQAYYLASLLLDAALAGETDG